MGDVLDTDLAYLAGIVDGEGHIKVKPDGMGIIICMADVPILEWCAETFGGNLSGSWKPSVGNSRGRRMWFLHRCHGLERITRGLLPYLVLKRREAEILLQAIEHGKCKPKPGHPDRPRWESERGVICARAHAAMLARK